MPRLYGPSQNGTINGSQGSRWWLDYSLSQNTSGNYTDISWVCGVDYGNPDYHHNLSNAYCNWGASTGSASGISGSGTSWSVSGYYYGTSDPGTGGQDVGFASGVVRVAHNVSGSGTATVSTATNMRTNSYTSSISTSIVLPQIPRQPSAPGTPSVTGHTDSDPTTATINWAAPSDVGAGLVDRQIQVSTNSGFSSTLIDSTASWGTSYNATGLAKGTLYYVRVRASSSAGWSPWSAVQSATTGTTVPGTPGTPSAGTIGYTSIQVSWPAPGDNGGQSISGYTIDRATNSGFTTGFASHSSPSPSYTISGLTATTNYWVRVKAVNATGTGAASSSLATATQTATAPNSPAAPTYTNVGGTSVDVNWVTPGTNGAAITSYSLQRAPNSSGSPGTWATVQSGISAVATATQVTGLDYGEIYWFRVVAVSAPGSSTGAQSSVTMGSTTPFAPAIPTVDQITQITARANYVAPDDGGSAITGYDIQRATDSAFTAGVVTTPDTASPLSMTGLTPAVDYWVRVRAKNANGNGAWSTSVSFTALPSAYVFSGSTPIGCQVCTWNGSAWVVATTQSWNGSEWL